MFEQYSDEELKRAAMDIYVFYQTKVDICKANHCDTCPFGKHCSDRDANDIYACLVTMRKPTRQSELIKLFPELADACENGVLDICPIEMNFMPECPDNTNCDECKRRFWFGPMEEQGKEGV